MPQKIKKFFFKFGRNAAVLQFFNVIVSFGFFGNIFELWFAAFVLVESDVSQINGLFLVWSFHTDNFSSQQDSN